MAKKNSVCTKLDKDYYDKFFEPERRKLSSKLGINLSQQKFTSYLYRSGAKIQYPKVNKTFAPKRFRNGGLNF